jgi:pimeloyl-ACP methyl ester carboxylesterase
MQDSLLQVATSDGLYLHGYYSSSQQKKVGILHIHGFEGNFYENNFVHVLLKVMKNNDVGLLTANTRGNGKVTEFNTTDGKTRVIGAQNELLSEAHLDITAWLTILIDEGYSEIILMGHSLGTMKAVRYFSEGEYKNKINKLVLLSPFDKKALLDESGRNNISDLLQKAKKMVDTGKGDEIITKEFDDISLSYKAFLSWFSQDDLGRVFEFCSPSYDFPALKQLKVPTKIIVGSRDEYFFVTEPDHPEKAMNILLDNIPNAQGKIIPEAVHSFAHHEDMLAEEVLNFVVEKK